MKILSYTLYITLLKILVSIPTLHASQRESSCSSAFLGTITSTSKYTRQQRLQIIRTNLMNLTLSDLAHSNQTSRGEEEEKENEKKPTFNQGELVALLPCRHNFCHAYLEQSMEGRAEGQLPRCPDCNREFEMDHIVYAIAA